jgi:hypothetical protein
LLAQGNGLVSLAEQLIAAKLNVLNGAPVPASVADAIAQADALIKNAASPNSIPPVGDGYLSPSATASLTSELESYNSGMVGGTVFCPGQTRSPPSPPAPPSVPCVYIVDYWMSHPAAWPAAATNLTLGDVSYSKAQLLQILSQAAQVRWFGVFGGAALHAPQAQRHCSAV